MIVRTRQQLVIHKLPKIFADAGCTTALCGYDMQQSPTGGTSIPDEIEVVPCPICQAVYEMEFIPFANALANRLREEGKLHDE